MAENRNADTQRAHQVYDRHIKPVEQDHEGEFALVTPDGETLFAPTLVEIARLADERPDRDNYLFKVGDLVLGHLR